MNLLEIDGLTHRYKNQVILENISFSIKKGEIIFILGANGSGKSTFLKIVSGIISSKLNTDGINIGYVPQRHSVNKLLPISAKEFVLSGKDTIFLKKEDEKRAEELLEKLGLYHKKEQLLSSLSGGEVQKCFILRAMMNNPDLILLDEPVSNIDFKSKKRLEEFLKELKDEGKSVIIVSHFIDNTIAISDKIAHIHDKDIHLHDISDKLRDVLESISDKSCCDFELLETITGKIA